MIVLQAKLRSANDDFRGSHEETKGSGLGGVYSHKSCSEYHTKSNFVGSGHLQTTDNLDGKHHNDYVGDDIEDGNCTESQGIVPAASLRNSYVPSTLNRLTDDEAKKGGYDAEFDRQKLAGVHNLCCQKDFDEVRNVKVRIQNANVMAGAAENNS
ncbi:hypothetical protein CSIM01_03213 [Colletotrichum simmondsii]|uniref:Uncharacterized protein n=1 Tax=Colletotrichum simmondsii TaxID=703756 RepID=A0A135SBM1_9PEZI|nr:hypothetical protein CSIM01_03213 [Colletotrichum simmondsii]